MKKPKNIFRGFTIDQELSDRLDRYANEQDLSVSLVIRLALKAYLPEEKGKRPTRG